jgi:glycosyltransferase involved in cell wall biosynthesis
MGFIYAANFGCISRGFNNKKSIYKNPSEFYFSERKEMKDESPLITVIVAVYNAFNTLQQCLDSVVNQAHANVQLVVIDGASTDGSVDVLRGMTDQIDFWISEPDNGIYSAWNKGLLQAKGEWICFIGADDYFCNTSVLKKISDALISLPINIDVAYGKIVLLGRENNAMYELGQPWEQIQVRFKSIMCLPHPGLMHRRTVFEKYGNFDETFKIAADYDMLLRILLNGKAHFIPDVISVAMRQGGASSNPSNTFLALSEVRHSQYKAGLYIPGFIWIFAWLRVLIRLSIWSILGEKNARRLLDLARRMMGLPLYWTKT